MNIDKTPNPKLPSYLHEFKDCFGEIGCSRNEHHIVINNSVSPTVNPRRRIYIALKEKVNNELQRMLKMNIVAPIEEPTDWVDSMVVVEKPNGKLRICIDPRRSFMKNGRSKTIHQTRCQKPMNLFKHC